MCGLLFVTNDTARLLHYVWIVNHIYFMMSMFIITWLIIEMENSFHKSNRNGWNHDVNDKNLQSDVFMWLLSIHVEWITSKYQFTRGEKHWFLYAHFCSRRRATKLITNKVRSLRTSCQINLLMASNQNIKFYILIL